MNTEFAQLKMEDVRKELPEMVRSLEAYRQGSNNTLPIEVTLEEQVQGKYLRTDALPGNNQLL